MPEKDDGLLCPLLREPCIKARCHFWTHLMGKNPQTGKDIDQFGCAISWLPILLIEVAQKENQTGAAVESFRNEMVKVGERMKVMARERINLLEKEPPANG
jgi:hypothetical protein